MARRSLLIAASLATTAFAAHKCPDGTMDLHVFLYDGIVRDKDPADRDAASDVGCYFTVGDQTFTSDILLNTNEPNFRTFFEFDCQEKDTPYTLECYDQVATRVKTSRRWRGTDVASAQDMALPLKREEQLVFRASSSEWPASGEKATLADKEDGNAAYVMSYKFVYGSVYGYNLDASGHESDDESSTKKKKSSSGKVWVGVVLLLVAALTGALLVGTCCYLYKARGAAAKEPPTITGVELAHVESTQAIEIKSSDVEQPAAAAAPGRMV